MRRLLPIFILPLWVLTPPPAAAQSSGQHVDAIPYALDGRIAVGRFDADTLDFVPQARVFAEPLEQLLPTYHAVNAPGFFSTPQYPMLPDANVSFSIPAVTEPVSPDQPRNALYWGGTGNVGFGDLPEGHRIEARLSRFVNAFADGGSADVPEVTINQTGPDGGIHEHLNFRTYGNDNGPPDEGLYLLPMQLHQPGLESSDVLYLLFNGKYERDEENEIVFDGLLPRVDRDAQDAAVVYLEALLIGGGNPDLPGDFNDSGAVEQGDLNLVLTNWGGIRGDWANADGFATTNVDQEELNRVLTNWGNANPPSFSGSPIPEPAAITLCFVLGGLALRRR